MMKVNRRHAARCVTAAAIVALTGLCTVTSSASSKSAATAEALVQQVLAAAQKGDVAGVLSCYTSESARVITESFADRAELARAMAEFQAALDARFGKGAEMLGEPVEDLKAAFGDLLGAEVVSKKARTDGSVELVAKVTVRTAEGKTGTREQRLLVRRQGGVWKLAPGFAPGVAAAASKAAITQAAQKVLSGEYSDRFAAMLALANALSGKGRAK